MSYLKGIYYALCGRVEIDDFECRPVSTPVDIDEFSDRVFVEYSDALEVLAE